MDDLIVKMKEEAKKASENSYSPYSKFKVGAAIQDQDGNIYSGCNVENVAFPSGVCAEITAIVKGVSVHGPSMEIKNLVIYTPTPSATSPCGWCRQVINEFGNGQTRIICFCDSDDLIDNTLDELFPHPPKIDL